MPFFQFQDPWFLLFIMVVPLFLILNLNKRSAVFRYSSVAVLKSVNASGSKFVARIPLILRCMALAFIVIALARPQEGRKSREILSAGVDIVLTLDTSGSMFALDFFKNKERITRLAVVKDVVTEFVENRESDRLGLVVFGEEAFTQCPLTLDHNILLSLLDKLAIGIAGDSTAIGSAIGIAVKRLKDLESESKVIILLTDGRNNAGDLLPLQAAEIAKSYGIKIYTIGVGTRGKAPFLVDTVFGKRYMYQEVDIDEDTLKKISTLTGAKYFRATDLESLKDIYQQIDRLEKTEVKVIEHTSFNERFTLFLIPALSLILLEITVTGTWLRRIP
ncbi:MAG: VWA domain-containing protein [Nitrospinota bacterium]|nr:VWA domain-containing protein [Nitrospinota bacterium]